MSEATTNPEFQSALDQIRFVFSTFTFSVLARDVTVRGLAVHDAVSRLNDWDMKYGRGTGMKVDDSDAQGLMHLIRSVMGTEEFNIDMQAGERLYGGFYSLMSLFNYSYQSVSEARAKELVAFSLASSTPAQRDDFVNTLSKTTCQYFTQIHSDDNVNPEMMRIAACIYTDAIHTKAVGLNTAQNLLVGMSE